MAKDKKVAKSAPDGSRKGGRQDEGRPSVPAPEEDFYETPYIVGIAVFFALMAILLWHQGFFSSK